MLRKYLLNTSLVATFALCATAGAAEFNIPGGDLKGALDSYARMTGVAVLYPGDAVDGVRTPGAQGNLAPEAALSRILSGTGFTMRRHADGAISVMRDRSSSAADLPQIEIAQASPVARGSVETVTVTSSKLGGADVQSVPIAISAFSQEQLTATQTAGGPDLVKNVPNLTFSKTNFSGYNIQIRGIGTQAISVATDPAVAVAFNDTPFIRNHFFEQEFYDVSQVEVLRGPQGTLYGRNATAGVVNVSSARPSDQYEAMGSIDVGNYNNRRLEGMLNIPLIQDMLGVRVAGEWTKRDGYTYDTTTNKAVDGRDLWSGRITVGFKPTEKLQAFLIWEHFSEDDDRQRSGKALCTTDPGPVSVNGPAGLVTNLDSGGRSWLSQGCLPGSLYAPTAFGAPNAGAIPFVGASEYLFRLMPFGFDPYGGATQSRDLRVVGSAIEPHYRAKNDTVEFEADYDVTPALKLTAQTGYNKDFLYSTEDYNRFNTVPGAFIDTATTYSIIAQGTTPVGMDGQFCDPQLGCSDSVLGQDLSQEHAEQFSQEVRLASSFDGPFNFSVGGNFLHYTTVEDYYVFFNLITILSEGTNQLIGGAHLPTDAAHIPFNSVQVNSCGPTPADPAGIGNLFAGLGCTYIDPNPLSEIDGEGHNYFRSQNPYRLTSWAGFGEAHYQATPNLKLTAGLRWTDDSKRFTEIPSWALVAGQGYPVTGILDQQWKEVTGRFNATWTPKLDFTDQSLFYASYSRGYKGGGANPPSVIPLGGFTGVNSFSSPGALTHPLTFKPEFINSYEVGTKNTLLDGSLTVNASAFYYDYMNYQISQIVDRTSVNLNFNATVKGAELEATWEPLPGLRLNFAGGYEDSALAKGSSAIDLMDRTDKANHPDWVVVKPYITQTSNCILPVAVVDELLSQNRALYGKDNATPSEAGDAASLNYACFQAYTWMQDPLTLAPYVPNPPNSWVNIPLPGYAGFNPAAAPNGGEGFAKDLSGNSLPNTPPFTLSIGAQFSLPLSDEWVSTLRGDGYWQGNSFARVFNDKPYDQLHGYTNVNFTLIFTNQNGWQAMAYVKNAFDTSAITGAFLNTDDTGLQTNIFTTDPRLFGLRITKNW